MKQKSALRRGSWRRCAGAVGGAVLCALPPLARGEPTLAPLEVPAGLGHAPEAWAELGPLQRIEFGATELRERGYPQLPVLALALLEGAPAADALARAVELAPRVPALRLEAAAARRSPADLAAALLALLTSLPCLTWLLALLSGAALAGLVASAAAVALFAFARSYGLHTHALGHRLGRSYEAAIGLALVALLSLLPLFGLGPAVLVAVLGALGALRLSRSAAAVCAAAVGCAGLALGPGLDHWTRIAAGPVADPALWAAWRTERAQPLPGDAQALEHAVARHPDDLVYRLGLATYWLRAGELARADALVTQLSAAEPVELRARAVNLRGIIGLAQGDLELALARFSEARQLEESAAVLFNLSQAHARDLALERRQSLFSAANALDPQAVAGYAARSGSSVHNYLVQPPMPPQILLARLLARSEGASAFGDELRARLLGPSAPPWLWLALVALVLAAAWLRPLDLLRCRRCERAVCGTCTPAAAVAEVCVRCERPARGTARPRRESGSDDGAWGLPLRWRRAAWSLALPGLGSWLAGRPLRGWLRLWAIGAALALPWLSAVLPVPFEVGRFSQWLPGALALAAGVLLGLWALLDARAWLAGRGT